MFRFRTSFVLALAFFTFAGLAVAQEASREGSEVSQADRVFTVSALVYENGELVGMPNFTVREGMAVSVASHSGQQYALEVHIANPTPDQLAQFGTPQGEFLLASSRVFVPHETLDEWRQIAAPQMLLTDGVQGRMEIDTTAQNYRREGAEQYSDRVRVDLIVSQVDASWFADAGGEKSLTNCSIDSYPGPKNLATSALLAAAQAGGLPSLGDGDCCSTGCLTCCETGPTCCADPANCPTGCCVP